MTISSNTRVAGPFNGNGTTDAYPFEFKVFRAQDVRVVLTDPDGLEQILELTSDYTVSLSGDQDANPGGTVTVLAAPAVGWRLTVTSAIPNLQPTDITNMGGFYPQVIEDALDRQTIQIQQLQGQVDRSLKALISEDKSGEAYLQELLDDVAQANADSSQALATANQADATANVAAGDAAGAVAVSDQAAIDAANAVITANAANLTSQGAEANASAAVITSQSAELIAQGAEANASAAVITANAAAADASAAVVTANGIAATAAAALVTAQDAETASTTAATAANDAAAAATAATAAANAVVDTADTALATAQSAEITANGAAAAVASKVDTTDPRLSDARTPTGGAGGVLSGAYPNPGFAVDMATQAELDAHASGANQHQISGVTGLQTALNAKVSKTADTGSAVIPSGTVAQRDAVPAAGYLRFNSDLDSFEGFDGTNWGSIGGGATGGVGNSVFYENDQIVTADYTITTNKNAMSAGPIEIDTGVTVTVPVGSVWSIV